MGCSTFSRVAMTGIDAFSIRETHEGRGPLATAAIESNRTVEWGAATIMGASAADARFPLTVIEWNPMQNNTARTSQRRDWAAGVWNRPTGLSRGIRRLHVRMLAQSHVNKRKTEARKSLNGAMVNDIKAIWSFWAKVRFKRWTNGLADRSVNDMRAFARVRNEQSARIFKYRSMFATRHVRTT